MVPRLECLLPKRGLRLVFPEPLGQPFRPGVLVMFLAAPAVPGRAVIVLVELCKLVLLSLRLRAVKPTLMLPAVGWTRCFVQGHGGHQEERRIRAWRGSRGAAESPALRPSDASLCRDG